MYKMRNRDNVKQTFTFEVYLWALDAPGGTAYPIAKLDDGIFL